MAHRVMGAMRSALCPLRHALCALHQAAEGGLRCLNQRFPDRLVACLGTADAALLAQVFHTDGDVGHSLKGFKDPGQTVAWKLCLALYTNAGCFSRSASNGRSK